VPSAPSVRAVILLIVSLGACLQVVFIGLRTAALLQGVSSGVSPLLIGALQGAFSSGALLSLHYGRATDRFGARRVMLAGAATTLAGAALLAAFASLPAAALAALLVGAGGAAFYVAHLKVIGDLSSVANRISYMSLSSVCYSIATAIGPLLAGVMIDGPGYQAAYAAMLPFALAGFLVLRFGGRGLPEAPASAAPPAARSAFDLLVDPRTGTVYLLGATLTMAWESFTFMAPLYGTQIGLSATMIGALLSTLSIAMFAVRVAAPMLARRIAPRRLMVGSISLVCLIYLVFPLIEALPILFALTFVAGAGLGIVLPLTLALLYELSPPQRAGEALGLRQVVSSSGQVGMPLLFGAVGAALGMLPVFWGVACVGLASAAYARARWRAGTPPPAR
jgi:MFS family permease